MAEFVAASSTLDQLPPVPASGPAEQGAREAALPEVALAGRSNVGKSSLINTLVQRGGLARTSRSPGRTQTMNLFRVGFGDEAEVALCDLPGYGYARVSRTLRHQWGGAIERYLRERATLRAVVVILDVRRGLEPDDADLLAFLREGRRPAVVVVTKVDKLGKAARGTIGTPLREALAAAGSGNDDPSSPIDGPLSPILFSSVSGEGRQELWRRLRRLCLG
jgi:GTP-binding protein